MASLGNDARPGETAAGEPDFTPEYEYKVAAWLITGVLVAVLVLALAIWIFGLPALGIAGLIGTALVFFMLISYAAGW